MFHKRTPAVVISVSDHGESDKIVTFYSSLYGKLTGIAKGAKRSKRRFVNKLELFSLLDLYYFDKGRGGLVWLQEAELVESFVSLREQYERYNPAVLLCDLMREWTRENDGSEELFPLLIWALKSIHAGQDSSRAVILFNLRLLGIAGYQPQLDNCIVCSKVESSEGYYGFSLVKGGLVCGICGRNTSHVVPLSKHTVKLMRQGQRFPLDKLARLQFSEMSRRESLALLRQYDRHLLQRDVNSWRFISSGETPDRQ